MHRTSSKSRSLQIQRETVRVLASSDLRSVHGGTLGTIAVTNGCPVIATVNADCPHGSDPTIGQNSNVPGSCPQIPIFTSGRGLPIDPTP